MDATAKKLETEATAQSDGPQQARYLCSFMKVCFIHCDCESNHYVTQKNGPKTYIHFDQLHFRYLLAKASLPEQNPPEEMVLRLTGVITSLSVPPVYELPRYGRFFFSCGTA